MYPSTSTQQPAAICALKSPADAIHILEAVRLGLIPRVTRRLTGHERSMIRPGTVWVWEEEETNMRRWTDGRRWGASRVGGGGFLVYTESSDNLSPPPSRGAGTDYMVRPTGHPYTPYGRSAMKPESLIKQTYSTTMTHPETGKPKKFHVVAYSSKHNPQGDANNPLPLPQQLPLLSTIKIAPGIWPEWEHRRDPEYSRRAASFPPPPAAAMAAPVTATASPDGEQFDQYRGRSPPREAYTARLSPTHLQQQRYPQQYAQPVMNAPPPYAQRQMAHQPYPPPDQRYHPYHDPNRNRPYPQQPIAPIQAPVPPVQAVPGQPAVPQEMYYDDRRFSQQAPRVSPGGYAPAFDPYGRPYRREDYFDGMAPPGQYYDPNVANIPRSPENQTREGAAAQHPQDRQHPVQTQQPQMVPNVETTAPQQASGRNSPKMSIDSSLLNPSSGGLTQASQPASTSPQPTQQGGLTLPPLRLAIDDRNSSVNGTSGAVSPSGYGRVSPRPSTDASQGGAEPSKGEDARQLGELGKRVSL